MTFFKERKWFLLIFLPIILTLLVIINNLNHAVDDEKIHQVKDQLHYVLQNQLEKEKSSALRYALILSQNEALQQALVMDDEDKGYAILSNIMNTLKLHTNSLMRSQIITDEYTIFARSWDNSFAGMPLDEYRPDLRYFQKNKEPRSAIEIGRKLGFKATVPIYNGKELLGYVEVLQFFEPLSLFFKEAGIDLFILMDDRYFGIAIFMQDNPDLGPYMLANRHFNASYFDSLDRVDYDRLKEQGTMLHESRYLFFYPMLNGEKEVIGAFMFAIPQNRLENLIDKEEDLSFMINFSKKDLYNIIKKEQIDRNLLQSNYDSALLNIQGLLDKEEIELFRQEAYDRLNEYSKKELIGLLLDYNFKKEIQGKIE